MRKDGAQLCQDSMLKEQGQQPGDRDCYVHLKGSNYVVAEAIKEPRDRLHMHRRYPNRRDLLILDNLMQTLPLQRSIYVHVAVQ